MFSNNFQLLESSFLDSYMVNCDSFTEEIITETFNETFESSISENIKVEFLDTLGTFANSTEISQEEIHESFRDSTQHETTFTASSFVEDDQISIDSSTEDLENQFYVFDDEHSTLLQSKSRFVPSLKSEDEKLQFYRKICDWNPSIFPSNIVKDTLSDVDLDERNHQRVNNNNIKKNRSLFISLSEEDLVSFVDIQLVDNNVCEGEKQQSLFKRVKSLMNKNHDETFEQQEPSIANQKQGEERKSLFKRTKTWIAKKFQRLNCFSRGSNNVEI